MATPRRPRSRIVLAVVISAAAHVLLSAVLVALAYTPEPAPPPALQVELVEAPAAHPPPAREEAARPRPRTPARVRRLARGPRRRAVGATRSRARRSPPRTAPRKASVTVLEDVSLGSLRHMEANVIRDIQRRRANHQAHLARARQRWIAAERTARLILASPSAAPKPGGGGGKHLFGSSFSVSGRRRHTSRLVRNPRLLSMPRSRCSTTRPNLKPAVLKILVTRKGGVWFHRFLQRSGSDPFDRCAKNYARGLRFSPGSNAAGKPLNTWLQVKVEPGALMAVTRK